MSSVVFEHSTEVACSASTLFAYHARKGALSRLTPPFERVRAVQEIPRLENGARASLEVSVGPAWLRFVSRHEDVVADRGFVDVMEEGPFSSWRHEHVFEPIDARRCRLVDRVSCAPPGGPLGAAIARARLQRMFAHRHATTQLDVALMNALPVGRPLVVGITGASGLIGRELTALLQVCGHSVKRFVRATPQSADPDLIRWDVASGAIDAETADGLDAVVHLAAEPLVTGRLDDAHQQKVRESRVDATRKLVSALAKLPRPPRAFIAASGVSFYGDRGDETLQEDKGRGAGFLADVTVDWEAASETAARCGMRVALLRTGVVLSPQGGALHKMLPAWKAGGAAVVGSGQQWMPALSIDEAAAIYLQAIVDERVHGVVNAVGPAPVRNEEFTKVLAHVLSRPALLRMPAPVMGLLFGRELVNETLLVSLRVLPARLLALGHAFRHATLEDALRHVLGRRPAGAVAVLRGADRPAPMRPGTTGT